MISPKLKVGVLSIIVLGVVFFWIPGISNPWNARQLGDIPEPPGYTRVMTDDPYTAFLRALPLKKRGSLVRRYDGRVIRWQHLSAGVLDWDVLGPTEQCADIAMRIRAEYLWSEGRYADIVFTDINGKKHPYTSDNAREAFENYLKEIYGCCNTSSVYRETTPRELKDIHPGDVLVYSSREEGKYGHAVLVADVAKRPGTGRIAILCVEGFTPACNAHIVRNANPFRKAWFILREDADVIRIASFRFKREELRHY